MTTKSDRRIRSGPAIRKRSVWIWAGLAIPLVFIIGVVVADVLNEPPAPAPQAATDFVLPGIDGQPISLDQALSQGDALLYFSMGAGCDGCFIQIPEIEAGAEARGLTLIPIMVDPAPIVAAEAGRFGIDTPIYIDSDRSVSQAYGMLGQYGHGDQPSHSFALVRQDRTVDWVRHYAEMFVRSDVLFSELDRAMSS